MKIYPFEKKIVLSTYEMQSLILAIEVHIWLDHFIKGFECQGAKTWNEFEKDKF